jgi:hypothetical protein
MYQRSDEWTEEKSCLARVFSSNTRPAGTRPSRSRPSDAIRLRIPISSSRLKPSRPEGAQRRPPHNNDDRAVPNHHAAGLATCLVVTLNRFQTLIKAISITSAARAFSSWCRAASSHISSGTGSARSLNRVTASISASAARSASLKYGASRQAATAFDLSFDEIAPLVDRSPTAARQLASRARRRIQGAPTSPNTDLIRQRKVVDAFLAASRAGDFDGLLALLDPDVVLRSDPAAVPPGTPKKSASLPPPFAYPHRT